MTRMTDMTQASPRSAMQETLGPQLRDNPSYRWYLSGAIVSLLGDQFTLIALPWLALKMTGDPLMLGVMMAVMGVPRAALMLFGGAMVDRFTPRRVLLWTKSVHASLLLLIVGLLLLGALDFSLLLLLAAGLGLTSAFGLPAASAMVPLIVRPDHVKAANGFLLSARQFSVCAAPLLAGVLIATFDDGSSGVAGAAWGLALALTVDALTFILSALTLLPVRLHPKPPGPPPLPALQAMAEGVRVCWRDVLLRTCLLYWMVTLFIIMGPMQIGLPMLAAGSSMGAIALGALAATYGAGALCGSLLAGATPRWRVGTLGITLLCLDLGVAAFILPVGVAGVTWLGMGSLFCVGVVTGYGQLISLSWVQQRAPSRLLGRVMSLYMAIVTSVAPLSAVAAGWLLSVMSVPTLFTAAAACVATAAIVAFFTTPIREVVDVSAH